MKVLSVGGAALVFSITSVLTASQAVPVDSTSQQIVSPTVVATVMARTVSDKDSLTLLVLWRGSLGWYLKPGPRAGGGGGGSQNTLSARVQLGGLNLRAELDLQPRAIRIQGLPVDPKPSDANAILVDEVDSSGPKVVATVKIDPEMATGKQVEPLLKRSAQIVSFLQCDLRLAEARAQSTVDRVCQTVRGK